MMPKCVCEHDKQEHRQPRRGSSVYGECKVCLCDVFRKVAPPEVMKTEIGEYSSLPPGAPIIDLILERLERKGSPQGLNVIEEELRWLGQTSITHERLMNAVASELCKPDARIRPVAEGVYWLAGKSSPPGWDMYTDRRTLPCFYRQYPPDVSWDEIDSPANILPMPKR